MFGFLKTMLEEMGSCKSEAKRYKDEICKNQANNINKIVSNFSYERFDDIFVLLLQNTKYELNIFIHEFDNIFSDELFFYFKNFILKEYEAKDVKTFISTCNCEKDNRFVSLEQEFKCFKYFPIECKNSNDLNNFIVSDCKSYWLEDPISASIGRSSENKFLKACVNFNDPLSSSKLLRIMDSAKYTKRSNN